MSKHRFRVFVPTQWEISYPRDSRDARVGSAIIVGTGDGLLH